MFKGELLVLGSVSCFPFPFVRCFSPETRLAGGRLRIHRDPSGFSVGGLSTKKKSEGRDARGRKMHSLLTNLKGRGCFQKYWLQHVGRNENLGITWKKLWNMIFVSKKSYLHLKDRLEVGIRTRPHQSHESNKPIHNRTLLQLDFGR